jgi:2-succinyl-6-hydroxy-2,4-cyclohexadiene-1-carboxylate synthase
MKPGLLLLHGFTGSPESFAGLAPPNGDILAPQLYGHRGVPEASPSDFWQEVDRLAALVKNPPVHVLGYSLGARLALGLLVRYAGGFSGATLIGAQAGVKSEAERQQRRQWEEHWCGVLESAGIEAFVAAWEELPLFATQRQLPTEVRQRVRAQRLAHAATGLAASLRATGLARMPSLWPLLNRIKVPVLVMAGQLDEKFVDLGREINELLPSGELRVVPAAGHNLLLERPESVRDALFGGNA